MKVELTCAGLSNGSMVLPELPTVVGSAPEVELHLDDPDINSYHCLIDQVNGTLVVSDLVSQNGTWVNGRRVDESPLLPGDELTIGKTSLFVHYQRQADLPVMLEYSLG